MLKNFSEKGIKKNQEENQEENQEGNQEGKQKKDQQEKKDQGKKREKRKKQIAFLNRYSIFFHMLLACAVCFVIEWVSRHSFLEACSFVVDRNLVFLYNSLIVFVSLLFVYLVRRRAQLRTIICVFWLFLGIVNGCILAKRVSPFSFTDLKMVGDLFTMQSNYFTNTEAALVIALVAVVVVLLTIFWFRGPKYTGRRNRALNLFLIAGVFFLFPGVIHAAVSNNILTSYFENLAQGYKDYGFVYSFSASVLDRGMSTPENYSEETVEEILQLIEEEDAQLESEPAVRTSGKEEAADTRTEQQEETEASGTQSEEGTEQEIPEQADEQEYPNIICVLLESFVDPEEIKFLECSEDPIPVFHSLEETYSSGYLEVPVVGAGTANTEFEVLTGMSVQFFGLGELPYKTILKETNCESVASDLHTLGYGTHAVHNNGGNFYSRRNAFSMLGFDTFTSKEMMDIQEYTPLGTWPTDAVLVDEVEKSLDATPDQPDFVYTITVQGHGEYPTEKVLEDPEILVSGAADEASGYAWEYYVNMIHEVDEFIGDLIEMLSEREEKTIVILFGDHLPTMDLTEEDMESGSLFLTKYVTWNNFGLEKQDADMTSYQMLSDLLDTLDIHTGTMVSFQQNRDKFEDEESYQNAMELLQYDILYGEHYVYDGENPYPATDLQMGTQDIVLKEVIATADYFYFRGENFTKWSKVYVDGEKTGTTYISSTLLRVSRKKLSEGEHSLLVNQVGSSDSIFRSSNELLYTVEDG